TGPVPGIPGLKDIAQYLAASGLRVGIALETRTGAARSEGDLPNGLARLSRLARYAAPLGVAHRSSGGRITAHERHRVAMREEWRNPPDRAHPALAVVKGKGAFGRGVILEDLRNAKAALKLLPHLAPQAIAAGEPQAVDGLIARPCGTGREVTAELADVLEDGAALLPDVLPEPAGREPLPHHHGAAPDQGRARRDHPTHAVIHRQAVIQAIGRRDAHQPGEPMAPLHQPVMADGRSFGESRRSGGIKVERPVRE